MLWSTAPQAILLDLAGVLHIDARQHFTFDSLNRVCRLLMQRRNGPDSFSRAIGQAKSFAIAIPFA